MKLILLVVSYLVLCSVEPAGAAPHLEPVLSPKSSNDRNLYSHIIEESKGLISADKFGMAVSLLNRAVVLQPRDFQAYACRALALQQLGKFQQALGDADIAANLNSRNCTMFSIKANCYEHFGQFDKALAALTEATKRCPHAMWIYLHRGRALCATGKYAQATRDLSIFMEEFPNNKSVVTPRALAEAGDGNYAAAIADLDRLSNLARQSFRISVLPVDTVSDDGILYKAISQNFEKRIHDQGKTATNLFARAYCNYVMEKYPACIKDCNELLKRNGETNEVRILRAYAELALQDTGAARSDIDKAISVAPNAEIGYAALGNLNFHNDTYIKTVDDLTAKLSRDSNNATILVARARVNNELNRQSEAIADLARALEIDPKREDAFNLRAQIYQSMQHLDLASLDFLKAISISKQCPIDALKGQAACYVEQHKYKEAIGVLNLLIVCSHSAKPRLARSFCYEKIGRRKEALADRASAYAMQTMTKLDPLK
jgi:superkiller protein 3